MHKVYKILDKFFSNFLKVICILTILLLFLIIFIIGKESLLLFKEYSFWDFVTGTKWTPLSKTPSFGILPMILSTLYTSAIALIVALPIGVGTALYTSCMLSKKAHKYTLPIFNLLAGIPSVVYGFLGFLVLVKLFEDKLNFSSGESILIGGIILSIMILPYIISTCHESMTKIYDSYIDVSKSFGVSKWYMIKELILPSSKLAIFTSTSLGLSRAIGETMAVMMVIGNSPIIPKLLSRGETLSGLIALEMGASEIGSLHYHALYGAGFVLILILLILNLIFLFIKNKLEKNIYRGD